MTTLRRFAVIGNPVAHSLSPRIHGAFAEQFSIPLRYDTLAAPLDGFVSAAEHFFSDGGAGLNVTVPFTDAGIMMFDGDSSIALTSVTSLMSAFAVPARASIRTITDVHVFIFVLPSIP